MDSGIAELIGQARDVFARAVAISPIELTDEQLCEHLVAVEEAGRLLDALRVTVAAEIEERSRFELGSAGLSYRLGERRGVDLVEQLARVSRSEAVRRVRLGQAIRPRVTFQGEVLPAEHPWVAAAVTSGRMDSGAAGTVVRVLDQAARHHAALADLDCAEEKLVASAESKCADLVALEARVWREALDPDGAEQREEVLHEKREFWIGKERNGMTPFGGQTDPIRAARLRAAMEDSSNPDAAPRFLSDEDRRAGSQVTSTPEGDLITFLADPRSRVQRQHDALFGLIDAGLRSPGVAPTPLGTVMVTVSATDLASGRGVGWIDGVEEPICIETVHEMICDSGYYALILGENYEALAEGLRQRFFTKAQRRALAVRDGGCVWPGCSAPPSWCEAHHIVEWHNNGPTDVDNGVLLCRAHHHMLHTSPFTMKMIDGRPHLLAPPWIDPGQVWHKLGRARHEIARDLQRA